MNSEQAYGIIAKHIFVAYRKYSEEFKPVLVLADNLDDATEKAKRYFGVSHLNIDLNVHLAKKTDGEYVFEV
jgi:hypothetical protein